MGTERSSRHGRGLSIAEVLISLAISAMLLVGVATAYNASATAIDGNDRFFRATQAGRVTMTQLLNEIRKAESVVVAATNDSIIITRRSDLRVNSEEQSREFKYDATARKIKLKIYYKKADGTTYQSPDYSLASNVIEAKFGPAEQVGGVDARVPVTVVIQLGSNTVRLSDTTSVRRLTAG
jgi:type II secretory pathway component PulJ